MARSPGIDLDELETEVLVFLLCANGLLVYVVRDESDARECEFGKGADSASRSDEIDHDAAPKIQQGQCGAGAPALDDF